MSFRNGFIVSRSNLFSTGEHYVHDSSSPNFPYEKEKNEFRNHLKVNLCEKNRRKKELFQDYDIYLNEYLPLYKNLLLEEYLNLKTHFPEVHFDMKIRIKSRDSYENKVVRKLSEGRQGNIYDLFAHKIVLYGIEQKSNNNSSLKMDTSEENLIQKCYEIYAYLASQKNCEIKENRDYIQNPKASGYQSLHLLKKISIASIKPSTTTSFHLETQIKTFRMHEAEEYGVFSHRNYKNRNALLHKNKSIKDCVPHFLEIHSNPKQRKYSIYEKPFSECYQEFFGQPYPSQKEDYYER